MSPNKMCIPFSFCNNSVEFLADVGNIWQKCSLLNLQQGFFQNAYTDTHNAVLCPVHTSNNVEATLSNATMSNVASTLLPFLVTMSKQRSTLLPKTATMSNEFCVELSFFRQRRTLLRHCCPKRKHCRSNRQQHREL